MVAVRGAGDTAGIALGRPDEATATYGPLKDPPSAPVVRVPRVSAANIVDVVARSPVLEIEIAFALLGMLLMGRGGTHGPTALAPTVPGTPSCNIALLSHEPGPAFQAGPRTHLRLGHLGAPPWHQNSGTGR